MSARGKTEDAIIAHLKDEYSGEVYAGTRGEIKEWPCVVVAVEAGEEIPLGSGNTAVDVSVSVQDEIDENGEPNSTDRFNSAVDTVQDALRYNDLDTKLDAKASGFSCIGVMGRIGPKTIHDDQNGMIAEVFTLSLLVAETDI
jgi:hypothetical protein